MQSNNKKKEKKELEEAKREMMRQLERDKLERFGGQLPPDAQEHKKSPLENVEHGIKTVKTLYTEIRAPGVAKTCLKTIATLIGNVLKDQTNEKFRRINMDNEAIQKRVTKINGGLLILKNSCFEPADDGSNSLFMKSPDAAHLQAVLEKLKPHIE